MNNKSGCEIQAIGINYNINTNKPTLLHPQIKSKNLTSRHVLKDVNCFAKPWEILAIVGPSGAGKSSLLGILAGKLTPNTGTLLVNKSPINKAHFKKLSGYVTQKDTLFPLLTVEETLLFSARLRLNLTRSELVTRVDSLVHELGLAHVAKSRVGDEKVRGISGGERRRVSIGVDVIHDPKVLILDEPTSGLDSTSALQIIDMLKTMAEVRGRTIVLSIHQPGFRIVKLFNSVLLMANGSVLHHGTVDMLGLQLTLIGLQPPLRVNIVEFAIDSIDAMLQQSAPFQEAELVVLRNKTTPSDSDTQGSEIKSKRSTLQQLFHQTKVIGDESVTFETTDSTTTKAPDFANSRFIETIILTQRFSINIFRSKELFVCKTFQMLTAGIVLGTIFYHLKDNLIGAEERVGLFAFVLTFLLTCTTEALPVFLQEKEILMKETCCGSYRVSSYAIANGLVYLPFLLILAVLFATPLYWLVGLNPSFAAFAHFLLLTWLIFYTANSVVVCFSALVPNFIVGNSVISGVMGSFFLFSGYFISKQEIPSYWIFMHYISLFKYPFEGFLINEFSGSGKCLEFMFGGCAVDGEDVLHEEGFGEESRWRNVAVMVGFILTYRFVSYVILRCKCNSHGRGVVISCV